VNNIIGDETLEKEEKERGLALLNFFKAKKKMEAV